MYGALGGLKACSYVFVPAGRARLRARGCSGWACAGRGRRDESRGHRSMGAALADGCAFEEVGEFGAEGFGA